MDFNRQSGYAYNDGYKPVPPPRSPSPPSSISSSPPLLSWQARGLSAPPSKVYDEKKRPATSLTADDNRQRIEGRNSFEERRQSPKPTLLPKEVLRRAAARSAEAYSVQERGSMPHEENRLLCAQDNKTNFVAGIDNTPIKKPSDYRDNKPKIPTQDNRSTIMQGRQENSGIKFDDWKVAVPNDATKESDDDLLVRQRLAEITKLFSKCWCNTRALTVVFVNSGSRERYFFPAALVDCPRVQRFDRC
jgi:hypothetical protein